MDSHDRARSPVVIALAGRRIDAPGGSERFPLRNRESVAARIAERFRALGAGAVVASGACGADLLGHQVARALGLRSRVVLSCEPARFRELSVVDRPGDWGPIFDDICRSAAAVGDLVVIRDSSAGVRPHASTNRAVLDEAAVLAKEASPAAKPVAVVVWDGSSRGEGDVSLDFAGAARARGWRAEFVNTI